MAVSASAQTTENFLRRYNLLVSRVGYTGIGVENLLDSWRRADSTDINYRIAMYNYCIEKSQRDTIVKSTTMRYLGMDPIMSLNDSTGRKINYFRETLYDTKLYNKALYHLDKAIEKNNVRIDLYCVKADILINYGKTDATISSGFIMKMIERNYKSKSKWETASSSSSVKEEDFENEILNFCYHYYRIGSASCLEAFNNISAAMVKNKAHNTAFLDNMGAFCFVCRKDYKKAAKFYSQALKKNPEDAVARQNLEKVNAHLKK